MALDPSRRLLLLRRPVARRTLLETLGAAGVLPESDDQPRELRGRLPLINDGARHLFIRRAAGSIGAALEQRLAAALGTAVETVVPVYRVEGMAGPRGLVAPRPQQILIKPKRDLDRVATASLARQLRAHRLVEDAARSRYLGRWRLYRLPRGTVYRLADELRRVLRGLVDDVALDTMPLVSPIALVPNDTYYARQWNLHRIHAQHAWDVARGDASVVIAIIDSGVDLKHPDLTFYSHGINLGTMSGDGHPLPNIPGPFSTRTHNGHGTNCAGAAAARLDNGTGVAGIAGGCSILPLAFDQGDTSEIAAGLGYAAAHGADVISISFVTTKHAVIDDALDEAMAAGCVLCAATGNDNVGSVSYPASYPGVIAVGGASTNDHRKSPNSPDGEDWGANYGEELSVVAPCVQIPTTDMRGADGENVDGGKYKTGGVKYKPGGDAAGDYLWYFNGTSSAAPQVAGLAALVWSANPLLEAADVRDLIEQQADKTGSTDYESSADHPNGTWNKHLGYGRINARHTVHAAAMRFVEQYNQMFY